jgi:hypothetical protein
MKRGRSGRALLDRDGDGQVTKKELDGQAKAFRLRMESGGSAAVADGVPAAGDQANSLPMQHSCPGDALLVCPRASTGCGSEAGNHGERSVILVPTLTLRLTTLMVDAGQALVAPPP